jgi:hypothetical protein
MPAFWDADMGRFAPGSVIIRLSDNDLVNF